MRAYHVCMYILPSLLSLTWPGKFNLPQLHSSYSTLFCKSFHTSNFERRKNLLYCVVIAQFILPCYRRRGTQPQQWTRYWSICKATTCVSFHFWALIVCYAFSQLALLAPCLKENPCYAMILFVDWYDVESSSLRFTNHNLHQYPLNCLFCHMSLFRFSFC